MAKTCLIRLTAVLALVVMSGRGGIAQQPAASTGPAGRQWLTVDTSKKVNQSNFRGLEEWPAPNEWRLGPDLPIIDAHEHARFSGTKERTSGIVDSREQLLAEWKRAGVVGAVVHEQGTNPDPDRFPFDDPRAIHCAGIRFPFDTAVLARASKKFRCAKIYLGYVHAFAYDPRYEPVYRLAERYGVPVVFHTGDTYSATAKLKYADPLTIDEVAVDHPKVTFVIAHCGNPWIEPAAEVAFKNPNVYLECSAFMIGAASAFTPEKTKRMVATPVAWIFNFVEDSRKIMFGTDWPLADIASYVAAFKQAIPEEHWRAVFHDNAARVFKLDTASRP